MKKYFFILTSTLLPAFVFSAGEDVTSIVPQNCWDTECTLADLIVLFNNVGYWSIIFVTSVATVLFVYAGFLYIMAQGDTGKVKQATGIFRNVVIGFVIILASYILVKELLIKLGAEQGLINLIQ